jgi:signal transduction histidine kinase
MNILAALKEVPEFKNLAESHLVWLSEKGTTSEHKDGEKLFSLGEPIDSMRVVLEGGVDLYRVQGNTTRYFGTAEKGEITGLLPYSRMKAAGAEGTAVGDTRLFSLHKDHFVEMIREHPELAEVLVHTMTDRVRDFTHQQQQDDKMMALGKLSAGLAHELNNPSAAIVRCAQELKKHLGNVPEKFKRVINIRATEAIVDQVNQFVDTKITTAATQKPLSLMEKSEREDELAEWLQDIGLDDAYETASIFVEFFIDTNDLEELNKILRTEDRPAVLNWIAQALTTERLVNEIEEASRRINVLVTSVKSYTHLDRAPAKERAELRAGIRNTITMLNHKIKKNQVTVLETIPDDLPEPCIYVSAMNQVWTNLIDNALDALEGRPNATLEIKAEKDREFIIVYVIDNGPGIPEDIQDKIFDSFFTTKPVGKGTGLGLEVVRQIILQHNGKVTVKSQPGRTAFAVCIPIQ